jgi:hypothetical protein
MTNQDFGRPNPERAAAENRRNSEGVADWTAKIAKEALNTASSLAGDAADKVKQAASDTAASLSGEVKEMLNRQVDRSAETVGYVARSAKRAADDLERDCPQVAGLVRSMSSQIDGYADFLHNQSVDQLWRSAADFTRRQPAVVFGLAALAGFFVLRTVKSSPSISAPSLQPSYPDPERKSHDF